MNNQSTSIATMQYDKRLLTETILDNCCNLSDRSIRVEYKIAHRNYFTETLIKGPKMYFSMYELIPTRIHPSLSAA
jgi:hypothetical protein